MYETEYLRALGFTWTDIARFLRSTLYRRIEESGLSFCGYTNITDGQLDDYIRQIMADHPHKGEVMVAGHLRSRCILEPRLRIRASIHGLDTFVRDHLRSTVRRNTYQVQSPNYLWHLDGNHKLI